MYIYIYMYVCICIYGIFLLARANVNAAYFVGPRARACTFFPPSPAKFLSLCGISHGYFETSSPTNLYILSLAG